MGAGRGPLITFFQIKLIMAVLEGYNGVKFQQAFINRPEFLHIERRVIDPRDLAGRLVLKNTQVFDASQQHPVRQMALIENPKCIRAEQVTGQGFDAQISAFGIGFK